MSSPALPPLLTETITKLSLPIPLTPAVTSAIHYARAHSSDVTYNHIVRSLLFGFLIAPRLASPQTLDTEVHAVAAILHDLGWDPTGALVSPDRRFEVDSAEAARTFLRSLENTETWTERRLQLVWDAIALHTTFGIVKYKEPEVVACWYGILADFVGPEGVPEGTLTWEEYNVVVAAFPRLKLLKGVKEIFCEFCRSKPETTYDNLVGSWGEKYVEGYSLKDHLAVDVFDACPLEDSF